MGIVLVHHVAKNKDADLKLIKHSPGPWKNRCEFNRHSLPDGAVIFDANNQPIFEMQDDCWGKEKPFVQNIFLVTAAPDLFDALAQWRNAEASGDPIELQNARVSRDEAIEKATTGELNGI